MKFDPHTLANMYGFTVDITMSKYCGGVLD
jgi:hypothetical protein